MKKSVLQDEFTTLHSNLLFGENCTAETAFDALDKDGNGVVSSWCWYFREFFI